MGTMLEVRNLKKHFKVNAGLLHAVDGVSFKLEEGHTLGVVGESGCGKSTLGRVILHLHDSTGGQILYHGKDITNVSRLELSRLRHEMQIIFQDPYSSLNPRMTVFQTIAEPMEIVGKFSSDEIEHRVYEMMDTVGLARRFVNSYPHELDGGRRQRIGISRALVLNPKFIVCDEPVSALDVSIQAQVVNMLEDLQDKMGLTYLFIAHDLSMVKHISDRIGVMYLGKMMEICGSNELYRKPLHPYTQALLSSIPIPDPRKNRDSKRIILQGDVKSPINPPEGCRFNSRCRYCEQICKEVTPELLEIEKDHFVACHLVDKINQ